MPPVVPSRHSHQVLVWSSFLNLVLLCSCYFLLICVALILIEKLAAPISPHLLALNNTPVFYISAVVVAFSDLLVVKSSLCQFSDNIMEARKEGVISSAGEAGYSCLGVAALDHSPRIARGLHTLELPVSLCYQGTQRVLPSPLHPSCDLEKFPDFLKHSSLTITTYIFPYRMTTFSKTCTPWGLLIHPFRNLVG